MATTNTGVGALLKDKNLSNEIVQSKDVPLLGAKFNIFIGKGTEKKLFALDTGEASIYGENASVPANDTTFAEVSFEQVRVADSIEMSQQAINAEDVNLTAHVKDILSKRSLKGFAKYAFGYGSGGGDADFQSILDYNVSYHATTAPTGNKNKVNGTDITTVTGGVTLANLKTVFDEFTSTNSGEAIWVVDSLTTISAIVDEAGQPLLKRENRAGGSIGTIYGVHVFVQPMNAKAQMVLMNPKAYAVSVSENSGITEGDNHISAKKTFTGNTYAQGKVVDPNAIKIIKA